MTNALAAYKKKFERKSIMLSLPRKDLLDKEFAFLRNSNLSQITKEIGLRWWKSHNREKSELQENDPDVPCCNRGFESLSYILRLSTICRPT